MAVEIVKADGTREPFERTKLESSLRRAGATERTVADIADTIEEALTPGTSTERIYEQAFSMLKDIENRESAARYSQKKALFNLGPTGYPFEVFVSGILEAEGWNTRIQERVDGKCTWHEVDVIACKDGVCLGIEAKFHNQQGTKSDVIDTLYVRARFTDIVEAGGDITEGCLVTNTNFTSQAIEYGHCAGLTLVGWNCPRGDTLEDRIARTGVRPITAMTTLSLEECKELLSHDIVLCRHVLENLETLTTYGISKDRLPEIEEEAQNLCRPSQ